MAGYCGYDGAPTSISGMSRASLFSRLRRSIRIARFCDDHGLSTREGIERAAAVDRARASRRAFLKGLGGTVAAGALLAGPRLGLRRAFGAPKPSPSIDVGVVGAGLAGLTCTRDLLDGGATATLYEASDRAGGRQFSLRGFFPGQVAERGGEFIDNLHKTLLGYANELALDLEDVTKVPGEVFYHFGGVAHPESTVVDEYRDFVAAMHDDLRTLSGAPTADSHNAADVALDGTDLASYLDSRGAGPVIKAAIIASYMAEYGLEADEQSCLNFLLFIHADKRSKFTPFGVFSDERWHVISGNDGIASGLRDAVSDRISFGKRLTRVRKKSDGRIELTFAGGPGLGSSTTATHDAVVLALPFTVLRGVDLDASLGLPAWKTTAIDTLGYGANAKMMVGFDSPYWLALGCNGASYSDLPNHQTTWETNPDSASPSRAILTDYSSGDRGASLTSNVQLEAGRFIGDLETVLPGAAAHAVRTGGDYLAHLEHWPSNPLTLGSYTCYLPGQFTTIAGNEGKPVGNLFFAGEHTNSFYEWQGFMEGAALSGIDAAAAVLASV